MLFGKSKNLELKINCNCTQCVLISNHFILYNYALALSFHTFCSCFLICNLHFFFSVGTYKQIRKDVNAAVGYPVMPEYKNLLNEKPKLRPTGIIIKDKGHDIIAPMQNTLEHTIKRLLTCTDTLANIDMVKAKYPDDQRRYVCYFKYGCDGLSGLVQFHQELDDEALKDGKMLASMTEHEKIAALTKERPINIKFKKPKNRDTYFKVPLKSGLFGE